MTDPERDVIPDAAIEAAVQAAFEAGWSTEESRALALKNNPRILHGYRKIVHAALSAAFPLMAGRGWEDLSCDDQLALATRVAANVGYVLIPEHEIVPAPDAGKAEALQGVIRDAIVETATRSPGLRGPYVFDEADLQATAASIDAGKAEGNAAVAGSGLAEAPVKRVCSIHGDRRGPAKGAGHKDGGRSRDPFHIAALGEDKTLCGRNCKEWLTIDTVSLSQAAMNTACCVRCAALASTGTARALPPANGEGR